MADVDVDQWLEGWVEENLNTPNYVESEGQVAHDVAACRSEADIAGISRAELDVAAGGSLSAYMVRRQNALTNAEVQRLVAKDD